MFNLDLIACSVFSMNKYYNYCLKTYGEPKHLNYPAIKIPILSLKLSASSIVWVVIIAEQFLNYMFLLRVLKRNLLDIGSTPLLGSSKNVISLPPIKASATQSFLLFPPLSYPALVFTNKSNCIVLIKYSTASSNSCPYNPLILPKRNRCSIGVKFSHMQSNYGHTPTCCITSIFYYLGSISFNNASPAVGVLMPEKILIKVDFPAPFGPMIPKISPLFTPKVSCFKVGFPLMYSFSKYIDFIGS